MKRIRKPEYKRNHPYVSERDARNLDDFFSPILCAGLRRFLTLKLEHIPADFKTEKEWKDTIRQMLWSFEQHHLDCPDDPYSIWYDREERKLKATGIPAFKFVMDPHSKLMELTNNFPAWPENLADKTCAYENKVKKGNRLFAKYYRDLHTNKIPPSLVHRKKGEKPPRKRMLAKARKEPFISESEAAGLVTLFTPLICAGLSRFLALDLTSCIDVTEGVEGWKKKYQPCSGLLNRSGRDTATAPWKTGSMMNAGSGKKRAFPSPRQQKIRTPGNGAPSASMSLMCRMM